MSDLNPEPPEDSDWEDDAMHSSPDEVREDYDHLAAARQMLGVYYVKDEAGDFGGQGDAELTKAVHVLEIIAETLIALTERMTWVRET